MAVLGLFTKIKKGSDATPPDFAKVDLLPIENGSEKKKR